MATGFFFLKKKTLFFFKCKSSFRLERSLTLTNAVLWSGLVGWPIKKNGRRDAHHGAHQRRRSSASPAFVKWRRDVALIRRRLISRPWPNVEEKNDAYQNDPPPLIPSPPHLGAFFFLFGLLYRVLLVFTGFYRVLLRFTGFYLVSLGFTGFYWVLLAYT